MKIEYIDHMGSDLTVVNSARVSFDKESDWDYGSYLSEPDKYGIRYELSKDPTLKPSDAKLLHYLASHNHWTPFSHVSVTLRETVPIFVARQRFKHTVGFTYNEVSRRYVDSPPEFYLPSVWRSRPTGSVKQGSGDGTIDIEDMDVGTFVPPALFDECLQTYNELIRIGVAPEQARMVLPQAMYTSYYVTGSLAAFARAYKLRADSHAQQEIQEVAHRWDEIIGPLFPESWKALIA